MPAPASSAASQAGRSNAAATCGTVETDTTRAACSESRVELDRAGLGEN
jgi:hypothetical protein